MENQTLPSSDINDKLTEVSAEDIKFLKLVDEGCTRSDGHYQLSMPFRNSEVDFPNNRWLAERRLQSLKKKLQKDEKFQEKDMPQNQLVYKHQVFGIFPSWCIPPHKPGKMRVVFDCSSEFQWRSLNKELLTGPDLTNQIVGVLSSFRENKIALMADIESLFYQVPVWRR